MGLACKCESAPNCCSPFSVKMSDILCSVCLLLASTREGLANADTLKVLTEIQVSKSILKFATNCNSGSIWSCLPLKNKVCIS